MMTNGKELRTMAMQQLSGEELHAINLTSLLLTVLRSMP